MKANFKKASKGALSVVIAASMALTLTSALEFGGGGVSVSAAEAATAPYQIHNVTQDIKVGADEKNNERCENQLIVYDSDWLSEGTNTGIWGVEAVVEWSAADSAYKVTSVTQSGTGGNATIPEDGFVLSGHGTGATAISGFAVGDVIELTDNTVYSLYDATTGYNMVIHSRNNYAGDSATIIFPSDAESFTQSWAYMIACEYDADNGNYKIISKDYGAGTSVTVNVPSNGFIAAMNGTNYTFGFTPKAAVGDVIELKKPGLPETDVTVSSGDATFELDTVNPTADDVLIGTSVLWTNKAGVYNTVARTDSVIEYAIEQKDGEWVVTGKYEQTGNAIPNYNGIIVTVPAEQDGANAWSVGDKVTVAGNVEQQTAFIALESNRRIAIDKVNGPHDGNQVILYDNASYLSEMIQPGYPEPEEGYTASNCWVREVVVEWSEADEGYKVTENINAGVYDGNEGEWKGSKIPENGFVLSGHGNGATALASLKVGDIVTVYDYTLETYTGLTEIAVNGEKLEGISSSQQNYDYTLARGTTEIPVVTATAGTRMGRTPQVEITQLNAVTGTAKVTVTAPDGVTKTVYNINIDTEKETNSNLASISIDGTALEGFNASTRTYTVKLAAGASVPVVAATAESEYATVEITQADSTNGSATIKVTAEDGTSKTYTVTFEQDAAAGEDNKTETPAKKGCGSVALSGGIAASVLVVGGGVAMMLARKKKND